MRGDTNNILIFILVILAGIVLGGFIGEYLGSIPFLDWLKYGKEFGLISPLILDLGVIKITFALTIKFTLGVIIGLVVAIFLYKKL